MAYIGGAGIPLQYPFNNYGFQPTGGTNRFLLNAGNTFTIPSGNWLINPGQVGFIQFLDPVTGIWRNYPSSSPNTMIPIQSDGYNFRVANLTGTVVGAVMTNNGSGYTSAPTVTPSAGGSTWTAIVGGALTATVGTAGSGYTLPPALFFPAPPIGGVQASGYVTLSSGTISAVTMTNNGAGYVVAPTPILVPNSLDPNIGSISAGAITATVAGSGTVTAVLCTYNGTGLTSLPTLTFTSGSGSSAAASVVGCFSTTGITVGTSGVGYVAGVYTVTTTGGYQTASAGTYANPEIGAGFFIPRSLNAITVATTGATGAPTIIDPGIFQVTATSTTSSASVNSLLLSPGQVTAPSTAAAFTLALGGVNTAVTIQAI
jgi:hypothetical protein